MNEQSNVALVKQLYDAFAKGDIKTILDHVTEDVKWSSPGPASIPYAGERTGPAQVREFFERLVGTQENVNLSPDQFVAQGDAVAVLGRYTGNVKGSGAPFDSPIAHFFTIRGDKVSQWVGMSDTAHAAAAYTAVAAASA